MSDYNNMLCSAKALSTRMAADTITVENLQRVIPFFVNMEPLAAEGCELLSNVYAKGMEFRRGSPCGLRDPQTNTFTRRNALLQHFYLSKIECKNLIECTSYGIGQFARNLVEEVQNTLINTLKREVMTQLMSDTLVREEGTSEASTKYVTALEDSVTLGSDPTIVHKIDSLTSTEIIETMHNIISRFAEHNSSMRSVTIIVPASLGASIASAFGGMSCCTWYDSMQYYGTNGFIIRGRFPVDVHVVYLEDKYFLKPVATYTRIIAFINESVAIGYGTKRLYNEYSPKPFSTQMNISPNMANALVDMRIVVNPESYIGVALLIDAMAKFVFMRMKSNSIMMIDVKDTVFKI